MKGREEGNMIVLGIGVWIVALSLVFIVVSALSLHQERRELYAVADEVSLSLAASVSDARTTVGMLPVLLPRRRTTSLSCLLTRRGNSLSMGRRSSFCP